MHPETLQPLARLDDRDANVAPAPDVADEVVLALAVWIGKTRLIDNRLLAVPAVSRERRSA